MEVSDFKFGFSPIYVNALSKFISKNDVRHHMRGISIKPHPCGGVILSATDGSSLVTIHDDLGFSDGEYIIPISAKFIAAAKKKHSKPVPSQSILYDGKQLFITIFGLDHDKDLELDADTVLHTEFAKEIDGRFPHLGSIFEDLNPIPTQRIGLDPKLFGRLKHCTDAGKYYGAECYFFGEYNSLISISGTKRQFVTVIMPMRLDQSKSTFELPSHAKVHVDLYHAHKAALDAEKLDKAA